MTPATHLDNHDWRQAFVGQMQYRGASGRQIGDAWAQVEAHCAESGERAEQAFGSPTHYAEQLAGPVRVWPGFRRTMLATMLAVLSLALLLLLPLPGWREGVGVTWGWLGIVGAFVLFGLGTMAVHVWAADSTGRRVAGFVVVMAVWQTATTLLRGWGAVAFTTPNWLLWLLAALVTALATWLVGRQVRDHVVDPRRAASASSDRWWGVVPPLVPAAAVAIVAIRLLAR